MKKRNLDDSEKAAFRTLKDMEAKGIISIPPAMWKKLKSGRMSAQALVREMTKRELHRGFRYGFKDPPIWMP
jgi:hypothetical protein